MSNSVIPLNDFLEPPSWRNQRSSGLSQEAAAALTTVEKRRKTVRAHQRQKNEGTGKVLSRRTFWFHQKCQALASVSLTLTLIGLGLGFLYFSCFFLWFSCKFLSIFWRFLAFFVFLWNFSVFLAFFLIFFCVLLA